LIDGFARQRRHFDITCGVGAHVHDRAPNIVRRDDPRMVDALIDQHRSIDQRLAGERRVIARVEIGHRAARAVALRTIRIEIGSRTIFERPRGIIGGGERCKRSQILVLEPRREQAEMTPGAQLVVGNP
jgi:hypothetical protein